MRLPLIVSVSGMLWGFFSAAPALAIPIVWDKGETITHLADLPQNAPLRKQLNVAANFQPSKLGYKHWRLRIFWCPIWTADGEFVAYTTERAPYLPLSTNPEETARVAGMNVDDVSVPLMYRFPLGWWIIGGLVIFGSIASALDKSTPPTPLGPQPIPISTEDVQLLTDEKYQKAIEAVYAEGRMGEQVTMDDIQRGVETLIARGVPREEAELNLALVLDKLRTMTSNLPPS
jgi:hypothetical protein